MRSAVCVKSTWHPQAGVLTFRHPLRQGAAFAQVYSGHNVRPSDRFRYERRWAIHTTLFVQIEICMWLRNLVVQALVTAANGLALGVGFVVLVLIGMIIHERWPMPDVRLTGKIAPGLVLDHEFQLRVWHHKSGHSRRTERLRLGVSGTHLKGPADAGRNQDIWSFETWDPNEANAKSFRYFLDSVGDDVDLSIRVRVVAGWTRSFDRTYRWNHGKMAVIRSTRAAVKTPVE